MTNNACLIFNPVAGQGNAEQDLALIESILKPEIALDIVTTTAKTDIGELVKEAIARGANSVIASGGDGTLSAVAAALINTNIPLGVIPRGTANAFANALNLPTNIADACTAIVAGGIQVVDMARCNGVPLVLFAGIGFGAETIDAADRDSKNRLGMLAYILAGLDQLRHYEQFEVEIETEDRVITVSAAAITIANAAPASSILAQGSAGVIFDDGLLDLTILAPVSALQAIATSYDLLSSTFRGNASQREDVGFLRARRFKVTTTPPQKVVLDGEIVGTTPIDVECIPDSLSVFSPQVAKSQPLEKLEGLPNLKIDSKV